MRKTFVPAGFLMAALLACGPATAEIYRSLKVSALPFAEKTPALDAALEASGQLMRGTAATLVRSTAEAYAGEATDGGGERKQGNLEVVFRLEDGSPVRGFIDLHETADSPADPPVHGFEFTLDPAKATECTKEHFEEIRAAHFRALAGGHLPGTAWFAHRVGSKAADNPRRTNDLADTFGIFSGGRAISENLALDRELILGAAADNKPEVPLDQIKGVTVAPIDWTGRLPKEPVAVDALSLAIPADQHALFAPGLPDFLGLLDRLESEIAPATQDFSVRGPFRRLASRYRAQLGLDALDFTARLLPAKSVAITGGDPFFLLGTDVAVVFESGSPGLLYQALASAIGSRAAAAGAAPVGPESPDATGFRTPDRRFSSYVRRIGEVVAVANSPKPLERLLAVHEKRVPALGETDEYRYFRSRYPLGGPEQAFVFLSDETIRRWAGPAVRIAASRRTRAVAALGEITSRAIAGEPLGDEFAPLLGETAWKDGRAVSAKYGSLDFLTPASELEIASATAPEREAYDRWRTGYESGWARFFDPIAIRIAGDAGALGFDLSLMPLTVDSDMRGFVELCGNARLDPAARRVAAGTLVHLAVALDTKSKLFHSFDPQLGEFLPNLKVEPLGWMSGMISLDVDDGLFWDADPRTIVDSSFAQVPVALRIGSGSGLKLGLFMTALKAAAESAAPGSMRWETKRRGDRTYVAVSGNEADGPEGLHVYYATLPQALLVALTERSLLRAMDREAMEPAAGNPDGLPDAAQLMLDAKPDFLGRLGTYARSSGTGTPLQNESWKALPILNEWHRMTPAADPAELQRARYGTDIFCPGGKGYRWNAEALTMESVAYGFPAAPRDEPVKRREIENVRTGLAFQDGGLRATLTLGSAPPRAVGKKPAATPAAPLATAAELTPLAEGLERVYRGKTGRGEESMTLRTGNVRKQGGATLFETATTTTEADGTVSRATSHGRLEGALFTDRTEGEDGSTVYSKPLPVLPETLVAGEETKMEYAGTVRHLEEGKEVDGGPFHGESRIRVVGKEDISVPAGEFPGCIHLEISEETVAREGYQSAITDVWYHPRAGEVKYRYVFSGGSEEMELTELRPPAAGPDR